MELISSYPTKATFIFWNKNNIVPAEIVWSKIKIGEKKGCFSDSEPVKGGGGGGGRVV